MAHVPALTRDDLQDFEPILQAYERYLGFVPNSAYTMAHRPELLRTFAELTRTVNAPGSIGADLKALIGLVASQSAGCRYCQAHLAGKAISQQLGIEAKLEAVWDFENSDLFSDAERAALRLARDASVVPNASSEDHFKELRQWFDDGDLVEIVAVIAVFGFLNRWNDTMATELEGEPTQAASQYLKSSGWQPGKHATS